jgi:hypothetical protein
MPIDVCPFGANSYWNRLQLNSRRYPDPAPLVATTMRLTSARLVRLGLAAGACAFALAVVLLAANPHSFFHWLLLGGTFGNLAACQTFAACLRAG